MQSDPITLAIQMTWHCRTQNNTPRLKTYKFEPLTNLAIHISYDSINPMMPFTSLVYTLLLMATTPKSYKIYAPDRANTLSFSCKHH